MAQCCLNGWCIDFQLCLAAVTTMRIAKHCNGYERMKHGLVILCMKLDIQQCIWSTTFACGNFLMSDECIVFTPCISDIWLHYNLGYSLFPQVSRFGEGKTPCGLIWYSHIYGYL